MGDPLSKDPVELRNDLRDALNFAIGDEPSQADLALSDVAVETLEDYDDSYEALELVLKSMGPEIFGGVLLHAIEFQTSLMGFAESSLHYQNLSSLGITMRELSWPEEDLQWPWKDEPLVEDGIEVLPGVHFDAAQARAVELGYDEPAWKAIVEHHLVEHRFHSPQVAAVRANLDGIKGAHWEAIVRTFTGEEKTNG